MTERYGPSRDALHGLNLGRLDFSKSDARVVGTHHGSYGSSRNESTLWLYHAIDPLGREDFWRDRESYKRNVEAHFVLHGANKARVVEVPGFTPFALDNSVLLPCTNPVGRAEDSLGSALMRYCLPDSVALELPVAIGHVQESLRKRFANTQGASQPRVNDFLRDFVSRQFGLFKAEDPGQRLTFLAHVMRDLACASVKERTEHLREYRRYVHAGIIDRLQRQLKGRPLPHRCIGRPTFARSCKPTQRSCSPATPHRAWPNGRRKLTRPAVRFYINGELDTMADACEHWPSSGLAVRGRAGRKAVDYALIDGDQENGVAWLP